MAHLDNPPIWAWNRGEAEPLSVSPHSLGVDMSELTVRKIGYRFELPTDDDGTPLYLGERMVEVAPGEWMTPFGAEMSRVIDAAASKLLDDITLP